ncbi:MAG: hypothetical protein HYU27_02000 [Acidobacteria bacterium]|nr:hypothetical protein [Acidobacteriota bacterium]
MKRNILIVITLSAGLIAATVPVMAHHAVSAEFDSKKPIKFTGTVKSVDWMNPHIYVHIESTDEDGKVTMYSVEGGPPNSLFRNGWRKDSLKPGDVVQVSGSRAKKAESNRVNGQIVMPDGRVFARGNAAGGASQQ